ncbi:hypothetical protein JHK87_049758 [Glycine soja]|nr:hypothetical protein JHK87_049758 [Glycine soja]
MYDSSSTIHNVPYADDVVKVSVVKVYHGDIEVHFTTSEIQFVRQAVGTFVGWPTHLDSQKRLPKPVGSAKMDNAVAGVDPLGELVKNLFDVYQNPSELSWDGTKFGIPNKPDASIKVAVNSAMKTLTTTLEGKPNQPVPRWIEPKSHVQTGGYKCGYYVMHWMWCIVSGGLKNEWNKVC